MKHYAYESPFKMKDSEGVEYTLEVETDDIAEDPRSAWDNLCTMVCWHRHYGLGDKHNFNEPSDFWDWIEENGGKENFCIVPLNLYDHSGITMSTSSGYPYNDRWDAGCVGFAYIRKEDAFEELVEYVLDENGEKIKVEHKHGSGMITWHYKTQSLTEETWRKRAAEIIDDEVETYDQYLRGDVYGFKLTKKVIEQEKCPHCGEVIREYEVDEDVDSCWGFYGDCLEENGILDNLGNLEFVEE